MTQGTKTCRTCGEDKAYDQYELRRQSCKACHDIVKKRSKTSARLTKRARVVLPYLTEWRSTNAIADEYHRTKQSLGSTMRRFVVDGYVKYREKVTGAGGKPVREYKCTPKGLALLPKVPVVKTLGNSWELLGLDYRPDWKTDKRYIPMSMVNKEYRI